VSFFSDIHLEKRNDVVPSKGISVNIPKVVVVVHITVQTHPPVALMLQVVFTAASYWAVIVVEGMEDISGPILFCVV
jgi:hypothetical protein